MSNDIHPYRAPMVTAIGIILGFVLAYMGNWVSQPYEHRSDWLVMVGFMLGISLLLIALYRILNHRVPQDREDAYYTRTLQLFMLGIICSFAGVMIAIFQQLL
ncbi:MAG: hypothetical protein Q4D05_07190 [Acinetobacter sp.]|nr:hypothetical protein [Acinetobacter sp.]